MQNQMVFQRYEIKYLLTSSQRDAVLEAMKPHMVMDEYGHSSIRNLYIDTPEYLLIRRSLEKTVYKEKIRIRSYGRAGKTASVFVELKKKYRSVVYKRRLILPQDQALECIQGSQEWPDTQIGQELAYAVDFYQMLEPKVFLSYERDAYHGEKDTDFRVTFDTDIRFRRENLTLDSEPWGHPLLLENQVLMELKAAGGIPLWMVKTLSQNKIFRTSYSKYGAAYQTVLIEKLGGVQKYA